MKKRVIKFHYNSPVVLSFALISLSGGAFTLEAFMAGAVLNAVPGIILQIILVPPIVMILKKAGFIAND